MLDSIHRASAARTDTLHAAQQLSSVRGGASGLFRSHLSTSLGRGSARQDAASGTAARSILATTGSVAAQPAASTSGPVQKDLLTIAMDRSPQAAQSFDSDSVMATIINQQARFVDTANTLKIATFTQDMANWRAQCGQVAAGQPLPPKPTPPTLAVFDSEKYKTAMSDFALQAQMKLNAGQPAGEFSALAAFSTQQYQPPSDPVVADSLQQPVSPVGVKMGNSTYASAPGDHSADGTVYTSPDAGGGTWIKHVVDSPFGSQGWWTLKKS
jgi:hypothetical protein